MRHLLIATARIKEIRARCELENCKLELRDDCTVPMASYDPRTGRSVIIAPKPQVSWSDEDWIKWEFSIEHELGHLMPKVRDAYELLVDENIDCQSFIGTILNIAEDHRQERMDYQVFAGRAARLEAGRKLHMSNDWSHLGKSQDEHRLASEAMLVWDCMIRESWQRGLSGTADNIMSNMNEQQLEWIEKLLDGDYENAFRSNSMTAAQEYELVQRIVEEVFNFNLDEEIENATGQGEGEQQDSDSEATEGNNPGQKSESEGGDDNGKTSESKSEGEGESQDEDGEGSQGDSDSDGEQPSEGAGESEPQGEESSQGGADEGGKEKSSQFAEVDYSDLLAHSHTEATDSKPAYAGMHINYDTRAYGNFDLADPDDYHLIDYTKGVPTDRIDEWHHLRITSSEHGKGLAKQVRRLLQVRAQASYQHGLKRGKISSRSIYRAGMGQAASDRVFKKKQENDVLDTAVLVMSDMSGSMDGNKAVNAGISVILLNEAISKIGVPLELIGFDEGSYPRHSIWKTFNKSVSSSDLAARFSDAIDRQCGSNSDGESLVFGYDRLIRRKEKRKIMIVLSDGSPASMRGDADTHTAQVVREIEKAGIVELYAIGIRDRNVERFYKRHETIRDPSELEGALLKIIERSILN